MPPKPKTSPEVLRFNLPRRPEAEHYLNIGKLIFEKASEPDIQKKYSLKLNIFKDKWPSVTWERKDGQRFLVDRGDETYFLFSYLKTKGGGKQLKIFLFGDSAFTPSMHGMRRIFNDTLETYIADFGLLSLLVKNERPEDWIKTPEKVDPQEIADFRHEILSILEPK